ncbi:hypothetical protein FQZ97_1022910 [compost metagenome]
MLGQGVGRRQCVARECAQCQRELHGLRAFGFTQVTVARTQRQAVRRALGFTAHDGDGQRELLNHAPDHHLLLVVLLAKQRMARAFGLGKHALEQLHHHSADADEKPWPEVPFQNVGELGGGLHLEALRLGIQLFL